MWLPQILNDGDTLWQISTGAWILDHHAIPTTDPFSFTAGDRHWFPHEWLAETVLAGAFRIGGMQAVMVLAAGSAGLTAAILLRRLRQFLPDLYAVTFMVVALALAAPSMLARPHLLAWPCLAIWCSGLVGARARRTAPSLLLLPVMVLWVNLHGSFMLGLVLPGFFMVEALLDPGARRVRVLIGWAGFTLTAWVAALLNPEFLAGVLFPIHLVGMSSLAWIGEWQPVDFSHFQPLEIVILGALALGFTGKLTLPPIRSLMFLGLTYGALTHARNGQLLGIVGALILAEPVGASLARGCAGRLGTAWRWPLGGAAMAGIAAMMLRFATPLSPAVTGASFAASIGAVPPSLSAQPVLNDYGLGGQLIFNGVRPFIDSRADLYGDAFLGRYRRLVSLDVPLLKQTIAEFGITWTIFPSGHPVVAIMDDMPGWKRLVDEGGIVIHVREDRRG